MLRCKQPRYCNATALEILVATQTVDIARVLARVTERRKSVKTTEESSASDTSVQSTGARLQRVSDVHDALKILVSCRADVETGDGTRFCEMHPANYVYALFFTTLESRLRAAAAAVVRYNYELASPRVL